MAYKIIHFFLVTIIFIIPSEAKGGFLRQWCGSFFSRLAAFANPDQKFESSSLPLTSRQQQLEASSYVSQRTPQGMQWEEDGGQSLNHASGKNAGHVISNMTFHAVTQRNKLNIEYYRVDPEATGDDLGTLLIARAISTSKQDFSLIYAQLTFTNAVAYQNALARGVSQHEAVKSTLFYKSCAKLGFGRILEFDWRGRGLLLGPSQEALSAKVPIHFSAE